MLRLLLAAMIASGALATSGCARSDRLTPGGLAADDGDGKGDDDDDTDKETQEDEINACLLHNCDNDDQCAGCTEGRTSCLVEEKRCVACSAGVPGGCPEGEECSSFGNCVPEGLTCETDAHGTPTITCATSDDCAACDPMHQVCDAGRCVACTTTDTSSCQTTDICVDNQCEGRCPATCDADGDCSQCGGPGAEAHACNAHKCAECSPTYACPAGQMCTPNGVCDTICGVENTGTCYSDTDCGGCKGDNLTCHQPLNGGAGTCGPAANGCSDLGDGVAVLPPPFDQVTNLCSDDADCGGIGITYNVGELLRDLTGIDDIGDANIEYPMNVCAGVQIADELSCGVCVPCRVDSDCQGIDIDQVALEAFGPLGSLAAALLLDEVFGPNDHTIHMYCEGVAGDYGVCAPCPGLIYECGIGGGGGGSGSGSSGSGGGGSCDHGVCEVGGPLGFSCDSCTDAVCAVDDYCCTTDWDSQCVGEADLYCDNICSGSGSGGSGGGGGAGGGDPSGSGSGSGSGGGGACHDECIEGSAMDPFCSDCTYAICNDDPFCCEDSWDDVCVGYVDDYCSPGC
jgi:hypothetical protein